VVPRILLATEGTLTHILEAYGEEPVRLVKLLQALVTEGRARARLDLAGDERALHRAVLLRGARSGTPFVFADSVVLLDRLPATVADGLLATDTPIGKLLFSCRAETYREIVAVGEDLDASVAAHFGRPASEPLVARTYQILYRGRTVARITEKFPPASFPDGAR
jgi:chorismate-pyruvate lyase